MVYLDYSATTPVLYDVLESFNKACRDYIGNANSLHALGVKSRALLNSATKQHIIVSKLEHPSIYSICNYLEKLGFHISYVNNDENGLIDFEDLKRKIRPDTILVSICAVNSELGIRQPLKTIKQIIKKENSNTLLHSDMTQAIGKISVNLHDVDLASMSAHKIFGPKGIGLLYKSDRVNMTPLIHGSGKSNDLKPGTPPLPLIVAMAKALRIALTDIERKEGFVKKLNDKVTEEMRKYPNIKINNTKYSIPHMLNISLMNINPETFIHAMEENEIYIGTNTACASGELSTSVMAVYNDKKRATTSIRISISHVTTNEEINKFLKYFDVEYKKLNSLMTN